MIRTTSFGVRKEPQSLSSCGQNVAEFPRKSVSTSYLSPQNSKQDKCNNHLVPRRTFERTKWFCRPFQGRPLAVQKRLVRRLRLETLEERTLFSLGSPGLPSTLVDGVGFTTLTPWLNLSQGVSGEFARPEQTPGFFPVTAAQRTGPDQLRDFAESPGARSAELLFSFPEPPRIWEVSAGSYVTLEGESLWVNPGDPIVPVRMTSLLLPAGTSDIRVDVRHKGPTHILDIPTGNLVSPTVVAVGLDTIAEGISQAVPLQEVAELPPVRFQVHTFRGFKILSLQVFPVHRDPQTSQLVYHQTLSVVVIVDRDGSIESLPGSTHLESLPAEIFRENQPELGLPPRGIPRDVAFLSSVVSNPGTLVTYGSTFETTASGRLPRMGSVQYVIVTSEELEPIFRQLAAHKASRGISSEVVTTRYIASRYPGTECGDLADRIREFITEAYLHWGVEWVLLGGDTEIIPVRGVYAQVGSIVERFLPTDLYYACLDGPWDGNKNGIWGESTDGPGFQDIDLIPEVFVGRAPVSNRTEAENLIRKIIQYESNIHTNRTTALWLGEALDWRTEASYSGDRIRAAVLPSDWQVIERYDRDRVWSGRELIDLLNASPHFVNHLGHASEDMNARITGRDVRNLRNEAPFFFYSQGCLSGAFDLRDISIGEQYVVGAAGALGVIMNTRYGWYVPGPVPGGNHFYALEFWDAVFNERLFQPGLAQHDARMDNLFRVGSTGVYRWIHFGTVLLGDPETPLQVADPSERGRGGQIAGRVVADRDGDGRPGPGDLGLENIIVYVDSNADGFFSRGRSHVSSPATPVEIPDGGVVRSVLHLSDSGVVTGLTVHLSLEHQYLHDLEVYLVSPAGDRVKLFSRLPIASGSLDEICFADHGAAGVPSRTTSLSGTLRPAEPLRALVGQPVSGPWALEIFDLAPRDSGVLRGWGLEVTWEEPHTLTGPNGEFAFGDLTPGEYMTRIVVPDGWEIALPQEQHYRVEIQEGNRSVECFFLLIPQSWPPQAEDWGLLSFREVTPTDPSKHVHWFRFQAAASGICTILAQSETAHAEGWSIELFDVDGTRLANGRPTSAGLRIDLPVTANQQLYLRLKAEGSSVRLTAANLLRVGSDRIEVWATDYEDSIEVDLDPNLTITVNGLPYDFFPPGLRTVRILGGGGGDSLRILGGTASETAVVTGTTVRWTSPTSTVWAEGFSRIELSGGAGSNVIWLYGSRGNDRVTVDGETVVFTTSDNSVFLKEFQRVNVLAGPGGTDEVQLNLRPGGNRVFFRPGEIIWYRSGGILSAKGFQTVTASSESVGGDAAYFLDSSGADTFTGTPNYTLMTGQGYTNRAEGFRWVVARSSKGADSAILYDSGGRDELIATGEYAVLSGRGYGIRVERFPQVVVTASEGTGDLVRVFDTPGDDFFQVVGKSIQMMTSNSRVMISGFDNLRIYGGRGGNDFAQVDVPEPTTRVQAMPGWVRLAGQSYDAQLVEVGTIRVRGFPGSGAQAFLYDSSARDAVSTFRSGAWIGNDKFTVFVEEFARIRASSRFGARLELPQEPIDYLLEITGSWLPVS